MTAPIFKLSIFSLFLFVFLGGCSSPRPKKKKIRARRLNTKSYGVYTVRPGDTIYSIARRHNTSTKALLRVNSLQSARIFPGQALRLPGAVSASERTKLSKQNSKSQVYQGNIKFARPSTGRVLRRFGEGGPPASKGLDFLTRSPVAVKAAADGIVKFVGVYPYTLGNFVIIKHNQQFSTVYGFLDQVKVKPLERVKQGAKIGISSFQKGKGYLFHFEIRRKNIAVNPEKYLK